MTVNLWEKDRKRLFRDLYQQYIDEGYDAKEAKKLAKEEAEDVIKAAEEAMRALSSAIRELVDEGTITLKSDDDEEAEE
mgnify:CR=1 FL=1